MALIIASLNGSALDSSRTATSFCPSLASSNSFFAAIPSGTVFCYLSARQTTWQNRYGHNKIFHLFALYLKKALVWREIACLLRNPLPRVAHYIYCSAEASSCSTKLFITHTTITQATCSMMATTPVQS